MDEEFSDLKMPGQGGFLSHLPPSVRAALVFCIPFIAADFFNYYSAGAALIISLPILLLLYGGCGALASKFDSDRNPSFKSKFFATGVGAGAVLWLISTIVNTFISLLLGTLSLGTTLLLGLPYLCLCAPVQLVGGALGGGIGGLLYGYFRKPPVDGEYYG